MTDTFSLSQTLPIPRRPRRNRLKASWRDLITETHLLPQHLVYPLFVTEESSPVPITSMPAVFRHPIPMLLREIEEAMVVGVRAVNLFCYVPNSKKDAVGSEAYSVDGLLPKAIKEIKREFPELLLMADIALDPFTDHGFDGLVNDRGYVVNDPTIMALSQMALRTAEAGVDLISPSDMMDGRVSFLRSCLDQHGFSHVGILSYAVKFASSLYAPFREALQSAPKGGDKKTYQVNPANAREAILECLLDDQEAADMLLIKPALFSLDIISKVRAQTLLPLGAYQVSGEYSMIVAAAERQWLNQDEVFLESLLAIRRAGADFIFTYAAKKVALLLKSLGT